MQPMMPGLLTTLERVLPLLKLVLSKIIHNNDFNILRKSIGNKSNHLIVLPVASL